MMWKSPKEDTYILRTLKIAKKLPQPPRLNNYNLYGLIESHLFKIYESSCGNPPSIDLGLQITHDGNAIGGANGKASNALLLTCTRARCGKNKLIF